jgi:hypothetical protein
MPNNTKPIQKTKQIPLRVLEWIMGCGILPTQESDENVQSVSLFYKITKIVPPPQEVFDIYKSRLETYIVRSDENKIQMNYNVLINKYAVSKNQLDEILHKWTVKNFQTFRNNKQKIDILSQQIIKDGIKCLPQ